MKNTFKKIAASIMAVASLTVSVVGMGANASINTDGYGDIRTSFGTTIGSSALSVTSTSVWVQSQSSIGEVHSITAEIGEHSGSIGSDSLTRYRSSEVSFSTYAQGVTYANSIHEITPYSGSSGTGTLAVYR